MAQRGVIDLQNLLEGAGGLTLAMIAIVLLGCSVAGLILALRAERSLRRVTQAIREFAVSETSEVVPEEGPGEVRILARAFNSLVERTRNQEEARRQLLANLTHELGRPLGALCSAVQALEGGADQDPELRRQLLEGMQNELERLQRLVGDLGELHNGALGSLELNRATVPLSVWLPQVLAPWREAAQSRRLQWQCSIDPDLPSIEADPDRLAQAVGNLLSNAIKYTPAGGTISVSVGADDGILSISVSDTGPGIPAHEQDRIFAPFYRARSDRRFPQGMGLGLTIARDVVQAHRGTLEVQSGLRRGSCFTIHLPLN
jgi:two-component system sensor histidine kinase BaeS